MLLEVIVQSLNDARAAEAGGADRLEIVREIARDGLTPSVDTVRAIVREVRLPVRVMLRENDGFAVSHESEMATLQRLLTQFAELRVDGVVVGFTTKGTLDLQVIDTLLSTVPTLPATLHRAFDTLPDPFSAIAVARSRPQIDHLLTSGGPGDWPTRCRRLRRYTAAAGPRLRVIAGGGVDDGALRQLAATACVSEVHVGRAARSRPDGQVSADRVRGLKDLASVSSSQ